MRVNINKHEVLLQFVGTYIFFRYRWKILKRKILIEIFFKFENKISQKGTCHELRILPIFN